MNIDPRILQALLGQQGTFNANGQTQEYIDPSTGLPYTLMRNYAQGTGDAGTVDRSQLMSGEIVSPAGQKNSLGYNLQNVYDQQGNFLRQDDDGSGFGAFGDFVGDNMGAILAAIATMGVASAAGAGAGAGAAEAGAAGAAGGAGSITLPTMAELGVGAASVTPELLSTMPALQVGGAAAGLAGAGMAGGGGAGTSGLNAMRAGELAGYSTNGAMPSSAAVAGGSGMSGGLMDWLGGADNIAKIGGALAGAYGSRDQQQTQSRDPWGPAQPFLMSLLGDAQNLRQQYQQNPLSNLQKGAHRNQFGLLDVANSQLAPGLLTGMQANATGANNYDRTNPRRSLTGSNANYSWSPQMLASLLGG